MQWVFMSEESKGFIGNGFEFFTARGTAKLFGEDSAWIVAKGERGPARI